MGARKAARISDFANEDSEDISRRSAQKDRKLLDDITTKLVKRESGKWEVGGGEWGSGEWGIRKRQEVP